MKQWALSAKTIDGADVRLFDSTRKDLIAKFDARYNRQGFLITVWHEDCEYKCGSLVSCSKTRFKKLKKTYK